MTKRKKENTNRKLGNVIQSYRLRLNDLPNTRQGFINDRSEKLFNYEAWISEKTLSNYECGYNIPTLENLKKLSIALEVDFHELVNEIIKYL